MSLEQEHISRNRLVTKNAMMLTIRMIFVTIIGLYTSRIVLQTLGVTDYGVYSVAGSFIGMISFLNTSMTGATNRFLCIEIGKRNEQKLKRIFSSAFVIHLIIALIIFLISETLGVWFLNNELKIPHDRMFAANCVFQCSVLSVLIGITQTPYNAIILAREKMSIYAYFEILNVVLKLLLIGLLIILPGDKLIIYAVLVLAVSAIMQILYRLYCIKHFPESRLHIKYDIECIKPMLKYSLTDLYGNVCIIGYEQSRPILLNIFFGVLYNAAASLSYTVQTIVSGLASNITLAFKPQILKLYAQDNISEMQHSMENAVKFTTLVFALISIPCIFETHYILYLWLGQVPQYTSLFLKIILSTTFISILSGICCIGIHATGRIKELTYITGCLYILIPLISWYCFRRGADAWWMFAIYGIMISIITVVDIILVKSNIPQFKLLHFCKFVISIYFIIAIATLPVVVINYFYDSSFLRLLSSTLIYAFTLLFLIWLFLVDDCIKSKCIKLIKEKF